MAQGLLSRESSLRILREAFHDELDCLWGQLCFNTAKLGDVSDDRLLDIWLCFAKERRAARQQYVRDYTYCPNIDALVIGLLTYNLRCHIQWRAQNLLKSGLWLVKDCEAKVCQLQVQLARLVGLFRCEQNVLRFDVTMRNVLLVHVVERQKKLLDEACGCTFAQPLDLNDVVVKFTACH